MIFRESQRFRQWWLWLILLPSTLVTLVPMGYGLYSQLVLKKPFGNHPTGDTALIITTALVTALMLFLLWLFYILELQTCITEEGIRYRFFPFRWKYKMIKRSEITDLEVIKYNPIGDYGGWGIRYGSKGKALNVSGNMGLMIRLTSGKNLLLGTNKPEELREAVKKFVNAVTS